MRLKDPSHPPPLFYTIMLGGRTTRIPKQGNAGSLDLLISQVRDLYARNDDSVPEDLRDRIIHQICGRWPEHCLGKGLQALTGMQRQKRAERSLLAEKQAREEPKSASSNLKLSTNDLVVGGKALWENATGDTVDQPTVETRANICRRGNSGQKCPYLLPTAEVARAEASCQSCGGLKKLADASHASKAAAKKTLAFLGIKQNYTLPPDMEGMSCGVCGCFMDDLLPVNPETLKQKQDTVERDNLRPAYCWAREYIKPPAEPIYEERYNPSTGEFDIYPDPRPL